MEGNVQADTGINMMDRDEIENLVACCGMGCWLYLGPDAENTLGCLRECGVNARAGSPEADKGIPSQMASELRHEGYASLPSIGWKPDVIFCAGQMEAIPEDEVSALLKWLYASTQRSIVLRLDAEKVNQQGRHRTWWEGLSFRNGFRVHPRSFHVVPYEAREREKKLLWILLEKVPEKAQQAYPIEILQESRILHMDMLRETGRRGDAHCIRYHMAAEHIRPGDTVLDVACGLGYGSHILFQNSQARSVLGLDLSHSGIAYARANYGLADAVQFEVADAQNLSSLPDNSIDFITAFETIEHVPFPEKYLTELKRVLRPAGRLMICAPHDWTDETGKDPNPHHLHIYTWERLFSECHEHFLLEKGFAQIAGGAMKCHHSPRKWEEIPLQPSQERELEWAVLLCMRNPLQGKGIPYSETTWRIPESPDFNVTAFARDYDNPWLAKGMVSIGMRAYAHANLRSMQRQVLDSSLVDSVDYGAALCGWAYGKMEEKNLTQDEYASLLKDIRRYAQIENPSPHQLRWQVSVLYAGAELARMRGDFSTAEALYSACMQIDVMPYSPLLGNKTLDALYRLSMLAMERGDDATARAHLVKSIEDARRMISGSWLNVCGDTPSPLPFGLAEAALLLDKASRAAYMLSTLDSYKHRPGIFACESRGFFERQLHGKQHEIQLIQKNLHELTQEIVFQDSHNQKLAQEIRNLCEEKRSSGEQPYGQQLWIRRLIFLSSRWIKEKIKK